MHPNFAARGIGCDRERTSVGAVSARGAFGNFLERATKYREALPESAAGPRSNAWIPR